MSAFYRTFARTFGAVGLAALALLPAIAHSGLTLNRSASVPEGFYRATGGSIGLGDYVTFCPPDRDPFRAALDRGYLEKGSCALGSYPMLKVIVALAGDHYVIDTHGVRINGVLLPGSAPARQDAAGRPMPGLQTSGVIENGQMLVMGDHCPSSFDSRYFGPLPLAGAKPVTPMLLWRAGNVR